MNAMTRPDAAVFGALSPAAALVATVAATATATATATAGGAAGGNTALTAVRAPTPTTGAGWQ